MRQQVAFAVIVFVLFSLGLLGQYQISPDRIQLHLSTSVYQVLMLFLLDGEWTMDLDQVPLAIEIVRFTAPLVAIASLVLAVAGNARLAVGHFFLRFMTGHTVVVGLGERSWQFLQTCEKKRHFVVLERDPENILINQARARGFHVVVRDVSEEGVLDSINIEHAAALVLFTNGDGVNIEVAVKVGNYLSRLGHTHLKIHIHLNQFGLAKQLEHYPKFFTGRGANEIYFFSVYDLRARMVLRDYPPEIFADAAGHDRVHLALHGCGRLTEKLIVEAALLCHFRNESRLRISVFDESADETEHRFHAENPWIRDICDLSFLPHHQGEALPFQCNPDFELATVTQHIICGATDEANLTLALNLRAALLNAMGANAPVLVRMQHSSGLAQLLESETGGPDIPDGIYPFGMLDHVLHVNNVLSSEMDGLAQPMHALYNQEEAARGANPASIRSWGELTQWERKQNLLAADHWPVRLRALHCATDDLPAPVPSLSHEEAIVQARMEHNRYVAQKINDAWRYGSEKSAEARTNPFLVPWEDMTDEQRERETRDAIAKPEHLAKQMNIYMKRRIVIGVTGHRLNKLDVRNEHLIQALRDHLQDLSKQYPNSRFTVLSPLAEGADRLIAKLAMQELQAELQVPLPLPYELYANDFTSDDSILEFQQLIGEATAYFELPMRFGNLHALAKTPETNELRNRQYALAGAYVAQRSDHLIAIYDGKPAAGTGGTGEILEWYQGESIPDEYLFNDRYFEPFARSPAKVFPPAAPPD